MTPIEPGIGPYRRTIRALVAMTLLVAGATPVMASAGNVSPVVSFLLKSGEVPGFEPGKAQVFRAVSAVKNAAGERPAKSQVRRYEEEGFVEAAIVRIHGEAERAAKGISSVFEFETPTGAHAEMKAELKEELGPAALRGGASRFFTLRHFRVPGVPKVAAFAFLSNKAAAKVGLKSGIAKGLFIEGNYLFAVGIFRPRSKEVTEPVIRGVQAIFRRTAGCP